MAQQNRKTLKNYFKTGALPSEKQFSDLIDSMISIVDDGFEKNPEHGLKIAALGEREKLISFFQKMEAVRPDWSMGIHPKTGHFHLRNDRGESVLTLTSDGRVGVGCEAPTTALDIRGTLAVKGRRGDYRSGVVPADGRWHSMIRGLDGCQAFEVTAGAGKPGMGRYALIHATAMNTFKGRGGITITQAHFDSRCNRMKLRWKGARHDYGLEVRTSRPYGGDAAIRYYLSKLWEDPFMETCVLGEDGDD